MLQSLEISFMGLFLQRTFGFFSFPHIEMMKIVGIVRIHNADLCYLVLPCLLATPILVSICVELAEQIQKSALKDFH